MGFDAEKSLVGEGAYTNLLTVKAIVDPLSVQIVPVPVPWAKIAIVAAGLALCATAIVAVAVASGANLFLLFVASAIGFITTLGTTVAISIVFQSENRKGPVFVYNPANGSVTLPRLDKTIPREKIIRLQMVSAYFGESFVGEVQLLVEENGRCDRFVLAKTDYSRRLIPLAKTLRTHLPFQFLKIDYPGFRNPKMEETEFSV